jgi:hypothetical protein
MPEPWINYDLRGTIDKWSKIKTTLLRYRQTLCCYADKGSIFIRQQDMLFE